MHPEIDPASPGLQGVFIDWGAFSPSLWELRADALGRPTDKLEWSGNTALIMFDEPDLKVYDAIALSDGLDPLPTIITRANFVELIDDWLQMTG